MFKKTALGALAAAAITVTALAGTATSAQAHSYGWGWGYSGPSIYFGHGHRHGYYGNPCRRWLWKYNRTGRKKFYWRYKKCLRRIF